MNDAPTSDTSTESRHAAADRALFDRIAATYCKKDLHGPSRIARQHRLRATLRRIPAQSPSASLLEVGCACGYSVEYLKKTGGHYVGLDYAQALIDFARQRHQTPNVAFVTSDIAEFAPDQPFDVIFLIGVLHHFDELGQRLTHMRDMLKPGGWLVANEPQSSNLVISLARSIRGRLDASYSAEQHYFAPNELKQAMGDAGFTQCGVWPQGLLSTPFAEVMLKPAWLMNVLARMAVCGDIVLEGLLGRYAMPVSWNVVAAGRRPHNA